MNKPYIPPKKILERYAEVMINFGLGGGKGIKKGDVVYISAPEVAKPLYFELMRAVRKAGGHTLGNFMPDSEPGMNFEKEFYMNSSDEQIEFFPEKMLKGRLEEADHLVSVIAEVDKHSLEGVNPEKIMKRNKSWGRYMDWRYEKEYAGKLTWTVCIYGTHAMASEVGMSEKEYWSEIIKACYLDKPDPVKEWRRIDKQLNTYKTKLNKLKIDKLHVESNDADLWIKIGDKRAWIAGGGANIPSFEIYTSPDWRGTNGWIRFNQPLYRYGNLIEGIELWFENGRVVKSKAKKNEKILKAMIATEGADKAGEYSLTDKRFSRITKFMGHTLYDENVGGKNGNTHIALGNAYKDCFDGSPSKVTKKEWERLGYNSSSVHTDIISTSPRTVTAYLPNGKTKVIYKDGQFTI